MNQAREYAAPAAGDVRRFRRGNQKGRHLRFLPSWDSVSLCLLARRKSENGDRSEIGVRQSGYSSVSFSAFSQFTDSVLLHRSATSNRRDITVSRNSLARCNARHLRIKHSVPFISVGPVYHNALTCCAALSCRTLRKEKTTCVAVRYLILRICGYMSGRGPSLRKKKSSCRSLSQRSHVGNLRQTTKKKNIQRKGKIRGEGNLVPILLDAPRGVSAVPFASQAKTQIASWKVREITSAPAARGSSL